MSQKTISNPKIKKVSITTFGCTCANAQVLRPEKLEVSLGACVYGITAHAN